MSFWLRVEPGRPWHFKWCVLSDAAYRLGDKLLCWGADNETAFVPATVVYDLAGGPRRARPLVKELVEAGRQKGKEGILEPAEGGWRIHHAEQYWPPGSQSPGSPPPAPPVDLSSKRAEAGRRGGLRSTEQNRANGGKFARKGAEQVPSKPAEQTEQTTEQNSPPLCTPPLRTEDGNDQEKSQPKDLTGSAREQDSSRVGVTKISCPSDLQLRTEQRQTIEMHVPGWAVDVLTAKFVSNNAGSRASEPRTRDAWERTLATAILSDWNNPARRPKKPEAGAGADGARWPDGYANPDDVEAELDAELGGAAR